MVLRHTARPSLIRNCVFCLLCCLHASAQSSAAEHKLTVEEVVKLTRANFSEEIVITKIKKNGTPFDLSTDELLDLKKEGVRDSVIKYLLDPSLPYTPPAAAVTTSPTAAAATPAEAAKKYPLDPYALRVPPEAALYFFTLDTPAKVNLKFLLGSEEPKSLMKKGKAVAYLTGPTAETHLDSPTPVLYVRLPEGREIEELVLVNLTEKSGRREIALGPKRELKAEDTRERELLEVGPRLYRVKPSKLDPGEYLLYFIGSAEPPKGIFGKGYDFSIVKPSAPARTETPKPRS